MLVFSFAIKLPHAFLLMSSHQCLQGLLSRNSANHPMISGDNWFQGIVACNPLPLVSIFQIIVSDLTQCG
jgi:hypothetical protein